MSTNPELRKTVRLPIENGLVMLRNGTYPPIACALLDLSKGGCHCVTVPGTIESTTFNEWNGLVAPGMVLDAEVSKPPNCIRLKFHATVSRVSRKNDGSIELGLEFKDVAPPQEAVLEQTLVAVATDKIRNQKRESGLYSAGNALPRILESEESLAHKALGDILVQTNLLTGEAIREAKSKALAAKIPFVRFLLREHLVKPDHLCRAISLSSGLPITDLRDVKIPRELSRVFSYLTLLRYECVPFATSKEMLCIAAVEPIPVETLTEFIKLAEREILVFLAPADQIRSHLFKLRPRAPFQDRGKIRLLTNSKVEFELCNKNGITLHEENFEGKTLNISEGGFLVECPAVEQIPIEQMVENEVHVRIAVHYDPNVIHAFCRIRHIESTRTPDDSPCWLMGLQIVSIEREHAAKLKEVCSQASTKRMAERLKGFENFQQR